MLSPKNLAFDGFYYIPDTESNQMKLAYFVLENPAGNPIESTDLGDKYHIVLFKKGESGLPEFDDEFEAILGDATEYITNLVGQEIFGCILRKSENSLPWWKNYLTKTTDYCKMLAKSRGILHA